MVLRISDLPIITGSELSTIEDNSLFEVSMKQGGYDSWVSRAMTYGDVKEQAVLCVAKADFDFHGNKVFWDDLSIGGDLTLCGNFILSNDNKEFYVYTNKNTLISKTDNIISARDDNYFYGNSNKFFGKVEFYDLSDTKGETSLMTIDHGVLSTEKDIYCNELHGISLSARWADLAEYYISDADYEQGTLIKFGGEKDITIADDTANGVITSRPGITINSNLYTSIGEYAKGVALVGRVPVKVKGKVRKFDNIKLSDVKGVGVADNQPGNVIGKALQDKETDGISSIECVVRLSL